MRNFWIVMVFLLVGQAQAIPPVDYSHDPGWMKLLHYRPMAGGFHSAVDDLNFFTSPEGPEDPQREFFSFLSLFHDQDLGVRQSLFCRYPLRASWLARQLRQPLRARIEACPKLHNFLRKFGTKRLVYVHAGTGLQHPESMFGHGMLRFDGEDSPLLSSTLNFGAAVTAPQGALHALKGLFGFYEGVQSIESYDRIIKRHRFGEDRPLLELELDVNQEEIHQLLLHAYELGDRPLDYYFLDENCSRFLLELIAVIKPDLALTEDLPLLTSPAWVVHRLVDKGLVLNLKQRLPESERPEDVLGSGLKDVVKLSRDYEQGLMNRETWLASVKPKLQNVAKAPPPGPAKPEADAKPTLPSIPTMGLGGRAGYEHGEFLEIEFWPFGIGDQESLRNWPGFSIHFLSTRARLDLESGEFDWRDVKLAEAAHVMPWGLGGKEWSWRTSWAARNRVSGWESTVDGLLGVAFLDATSYLSQILLGIELRRDQDDSKSLGVKGIFNLDYRAMGHIWLRADSDLVYFPNGSPMIYRETSLSLDYRGPRCRRLFMEATAREEDGNIASAASLGYERCL